MSVHKDNIVAVPFVYLPILDFSYKEEFSALFIYFLNVSTSKTPFYYIFFRNDTEEGLT